MIHTTLVAIVLGLLAFAPAPLPRREQPERMVVYTWTDRFDQQQSVTVHPGGTWRGLGGLSGEWVRCVDGTIGLWLDDRRYLDLELSQKRVWDGQRSVGTLD